MLAHFKNLHWPRLQTLFRWAFHLGWISLALSLIFYLLGLRLLAEVDQYRPRLEAAISEALTAPVHIERLEGDWRGLHPEVRIRNLRIGHPAAPDTTLLHIPVISVEPSFRQSLRRWAPRFKIRIHGLALTAEEQPAGDWRLLELAALPQGTPESRRQTLQRALQQAELGLGNATLTVRPWRRPALRLSQVHMRNLNSGSLHRLRIEAGLEGVGNLRIMADMRAEQVLDPKAWSGSTFISIPEADWTAWIPSLPEGVMLSRLKTGGRLWTEWQAGKPKTLQVSLQNADALGAYQNRPITVSALNADLSLRLQQAGWEAALMPRDGRVNGQVLPWRVLITGKQGDDWSLGGQALHLQPLSDLLRQFPLPPKLDTLLTELKPVGYLPAFSLQWRQAPDQPWILQSLKADIRQLSWQATRNIPGAQGLNGWVSWRDGVGNAALNMSGGVLDLKPVFREPTPVTALSARFSFRRLADAWLIRSNRIQVQNGDATGEALLSLWIPREAPGRARMQLLAGLHDGRVDSVWRYVPWPSAGDDTLAWLKSALREGRLAQGNFLYEGPLVDRPDDIPSRMQMRFDLEDATLAYAPGWPELRKLQATVTLDNRHLQVQARQGQLYESIARNIVADIPELNKPVLNVTADVDSTGDDIFRLFRDTPLRSDTGRIASLMSVSGEVGGRLGLTIPLTDMSRARVKVEAELPGNPVILREAAPFDLWLSGMVSYESGKGITSRPLNGFFLGQPLAVQFHSVMDDADVVAVQIQADGMMTPASLKPWMGPLVQHMHGSTRFKAFLAVPVKDDPVHVTVDSDLAGWYMNLPAPFGKQAEPVPLHFEIQLQGGENLALLNLQDRLQSLFAVSGNRITRAQVQLGPGRITDLPPRGLWVRGRLDKLELDNWLSWLRPSSGRGEVDGNTFPELQSFNLVVNEFYTGGYKLKNARLGLEPDEESEQGWRLQLESDRIAGEAKLGRDLRSPVAMTLYRLVLPLPAAGASALGTSADTLQDWQLPRIQLDIRKLSYSPWPLAGTGTMSAQIQPTAEGMRIDQLVLRHEALNLTGRMDWQYRGRPSTNVHADIKAGDIAKLFAAFDYPAVVNSETAEAEVALAWTGNPTDLQVSGMTGHVEVRLTNGRILKLNRTVSMTRLFGVLDTDNIKRRMQLNFSDITQKGMAYDHFRFDGRFGNGILSDTLEMDSPSMNVTGSGTVNLESRRIDHRVQIAIPLASAVPLAAALVAGPVVGGALVAAETVFDESLRKMTAFNYQIRGDWNNPVVERLKKPLIPWRNGVKPFKPSKEKP